MGRFVLLTFGKGTLPEKIKIKNTVTEQYYSAHHYDWIQINSWKPKSTSTEGELLRTHDIIQNVRSECNEAACARILQSIVLMNETQESLFRSSVIYISMINTVGSNLKDGENIQKEIKTIFQNNKREKYPIQLYSTLDHCDYVLIGNGDRISLAEYIHILRKLRNLDFIVDITTEYGFQKQINDTRANNIAVTAFISSKDTVDDWISYDMLGHFDRISVCNAVTWKGLAGLIDNHKSKIHIGIRPELNGESDCSATAFQSVSDEKTLLSVSKQLWDRWNYWYKNTANNNLNRISRDLHIGLFQYNALKELQISIQTLLKNGYSRYYVLCFFESFYDLLNIIKGWEKNPNTDDELYSLFNQYFGIIQALNASMLHSERRFAQADSFSMTCFDIPPKLIAYYTACANQMADIFSENKRYSFIFLPDFKKNTNVEALIDRTIVSQNKSIICIHISERNIYDIKQTSLVLAHEVAHHAAISDDERKKRYPYIIRCLLALQLLFTINHDNGNIDEKIEQFFLTKNVYSSITYALFSFFSQYLSHLPNSKLLPSDGSQRNQDSVSDNLIENTAIYAGGESDPFRMKRIPSLFHTMWGSLLRKTSKDDRFLKELGYQIQKVLEEAEIDCLSFLHQTQPYTTVTKDQTFCQTLTAYYLADHLIEKFCDILTSISLDETMENIYDYEEEICYIFTEGYADLRALFLRYGYPTSEVNRFSLANGYLKYIYKENNISRTFIINNGDNPDRMMFSKSCINNSDRVRHWAVLLALLNIEPDNVFASKSLKEVLRKTEDSHGNINIRGIYYFYVLEQATAFFKNDMIEIENKTKNPAALFAEGSDLIQHVNDTLNTYCKELKNRLDSEFCEQET